MSYLLDIEQDGSLPRVPAIRGRVRLLTQSLCQGRHVPEDEWKPAEREGVLESWVSGHSAAVVTHFERDRLIRWWMFELN